MITVVALSGFCGSAQGRRPRAASHAKYVFFFIGDGMANVQVNATEAFLAQVDQADNPTGNYNDPNSHGTAGAELMVMSQFPIQGMSTTFADNRYITGSAAAGTALSCGKKTTINTIAMNAERTSPYKSIAKLAKEKGMKVGIISSVSIDHATPAVFYANQAERSMYHEIDMDLANSGFDFFGGGGLKAPELWVDDDNDPCTPDVLVEDALQTAEDNGYKIVNTRSDIMALTPADGKVIAYDANLAGGSALIYEIDRMANPSVHVSLAEFTRKGIEMLDNPNGFFLMVEGGKIDWACHANDAVSAIYDTIAFDDAIAEAVDFMRDHPRETLIVVTGDHECGGLTIGFANTGYDTYFEALDDQTKSYEAFNVDFYAYKDDYVPVDGSTYDPAEDDIDAEMKDLMLSSFGLDFESLSDYQQDLLEAAFDKSMAGYSINKQEQDNLLYGYYEPITVTCTHVLNNNAGFAWTSYSHTGVPVPVLAAGKDAWRFDGFYDNTDIPKRIALAMGEILDND